MSSSAVNEDDAAIDAQNDDPRLDAEKEIVWKEDPERLAYVRERFALVQSPTGDLPNRVEESARKVVGYVTVERGGPTVHLGMHPRRYFYLKPGDRPRGGDGFTPPKNPAEAVDPRTVAPGKLGEKTARVEG